MDKLGGNMAKLQYKLDEKVLKNMVIARKGDIRIKVKYTKITKEVQKQDDDYEIEM